MRKALASSLILFFAFILVGCAEPATFGQVAATIPPPASGNARIYVYRPLASFQDTAYTKIYFNGREVAPSAPGSVFYRDVPPGQYHITALSTGIYPNQFKTVTVGPGDTVYAEIQSTTSWAETMSGPSFYTFAVVIRPPAVARAQMQGLRYTPG